MGGARAGARGGLIPSIPSTLHFCPVCGSTYWVSAQQPDVIAVAVGAFADPAFPAPRISVYEKRSHPWALPAGIDLEHLD